MLILCHELGHVLGQADENKSPNTNIEYYYHHYPYTKNCLMDYNMLYNSNFGYCNECYIKLH